MKALVEIAGHLAMVPAGDGGAELAIFVHGDFLLLTGEAQAA